MDQCADNSAELNYNCVGDKPTFLRPAENLYDWVQPLYHHVFWCETCLGPRYVSVSHRLNPRSSSRIKPDLRPPSLQLSGQREAEQSDAAAALQAVRGSPTLILCLL